ncbi:MAG TPA: type II toxin-antitoxin system VapC family toxin [Rhizobiaceae bacterium]|nr:type II toxin-antitoxin system VapC family toxin [Rhizobiaceae bacterium]
MVVDASAVLSLILGEPDAPLIAASLRENRNRLYMSPINKWEVQIRVDKGADLVTAKAAEEFSKLFSIVVIPVDDTTATVAIDAHRRYGKGNHPAALNMGDCFAYALAKSRGEPLLFKGDDFRLTDVKAAL